MTAEQQVEIEGRSIAPSNLYKVRYPNAGFTKAHVIDYYVRIPPTNITLRYEDEQVCLSI